jgi:hypothetical protein
MLYGSFFKRQVLRTNVLMEQIVAYTPTCIP